MANIYRYRRELLAAKTMAEQAQELFDKPEDYDGSAQAYKTLANISRQLDDFELGFLKYINRGTLLVENQNKNAHLLLASLYQLYGRTYRHYATYLQGKKMDDESVQGADISGLIS